MPGEDQDLKANKLPIYEPGLEPIVVRNQREGRLTFTTTSGTRSSAPRSCSLPSGRRPTKTVGDLQHVLAVATTIGKHMNASKVVVTKSTVPSARPRRCARKIARETKTPFHVCANPEFLKEGAAVERLHEARSRWWSGSTPRRPPGSSRSCTRRSCAPGSLIVMDIASAEMTKYAANAMLATRISFMNQIAQLCEAVGADVTHVRRGIGSDRRIGQAFLFPGPGYGGPAFPRT